MAASYKKLFKLLIDRDMKKKELAEKAMEQAIACANSDSYDPPEYIELSRLKDTTADYLSLIFHRYLNRGSNQKVTMKINNYL